MRSSKSKARSISLGTTTTPDGSAKSNQKLCGTNALVETAHIPTKRVEGHFNTLPNVLHHDDDDDDDEKREETDEDADECNDEYDFEKMMMNMTTDNDDEYDGECDNECDDERQILHSDG